MFLLVLIAAFSFNSKEKPIAIVDGEKIFEEDITEKITLNEHLKNLVFFKLAKEKGYADSVKPKVEENFQREMITRTLRRVVSSTSQTNLHECASFYKNSGKTIKGQLIQTQDFSKILSAYIEILKGRDFGTISQKYSDNEKLKKEKGILKQPIHWSPNLPFAFKRLFSMEKGCYSFPFKYGKAWNIIKVRENERKKKEKPLDRFDILDNVTNPKMKKQIVRNKSRFNLYKLKSFVEWIAASEIDSAGLFLVSKRVAELDRESGYIERIFQKEDMDVVLAKSSIGKYRISDFVKDLTLVRDLSILNYKERTILFIKERISERILIAMARRLGINREPSFAEAYKKNFKNRTLDFFKKKEILSAIKENEDELKKFYRNNKKQYKISERRKVHLIEMKTEQEAREIRNRLLNGEKFEKLASEASIGPGKKKGGEIGYIKKTQRGNIGRNSFLLEKGGVSEPFKTLKDSWAIIKVTDVKESYIPDYADVKAAVRNDYVKNEAKKIGDQIYEQNKTKYEIKVLR